MYFWIFYDYFSIHMTLPLEILNQVNSFLYRKKIVRTYSMALIQMSSLIIGNIIGSFCRACDNYSPVLIWRRDVIVWACMRFRRTHQRISFESSLFIVKTSSHLTIIDKHKIYIFFVPHKLIATSCEKRQTNGNSSDLYEWSSRMSLSEGKRVYSVISMRCVLPYTKVRRKSLSFIYFLLAFTNFRQFFSVTDRVRHFFFSLTFVFSH